MTPRSLSFVCLIASAACGTGRIVPADTAEPAAEPSGPTAVAPPAPTEATTPATAVHPSGYVPYDAAGSVPIRRIGQWSTSRISTPTRVVIRDDSSYARFWSALEAGARPSVDFSRDIVIAAAAGQQSTGGHSIVVERVVRTGEGLAVQVVETVPGPGCATTQMVTQPVDVVVVAGADARTWSFSDRQAVGAC